jgi:HD-GYP domain-containing protein (c-di-GMP phosphodiesterase class II)
LKLLKNTAFHLDKQRSKGVLVISFKKQRPFLINDLNHIAGDLSLRSLSFAKKLGTQSFICCPIMCDGEPLGILAVDNLKSKKPLVKSDISLLMGIASVLGISIRNADLMESRERQFRSVLHALAASIDARDPLTSGHSEKVTEYALGICDELGLPDDYCKMIRVAALLHDYGKIGVEIPLGAKIIAVADFFEAITARRHYRGPMPLGNAFEILKNEAGKSFEKEIVDALLNYYSKRHAGQPEYRVAMYTA